MTMNQDQIDWRRNKVQELFVKGNNHYEIANILQVSRPTITRDIQYLREQARDNIKKYIDERVPEEYEKCLTGLNIILKEAWNTSEQIEDKRTKIQALSLAKECYNMKLELLTHSTVVDDAMRFVSQHQSNNDKGNDSKGKSEDYNNE
jgi:DNA-binding transcriptional regulator LsrR (DeoR family)